MGRIFPCFHALGYLFNIIDLLNRAKKTLESAGRHNFSTFREIPSGPTDLVENCLNSQSKSSIFIRLNLKLFDLVGLVEL